MSGQRLLPLLLGAALSFPIHADPWGEAGKRPPGQHKQPAQEVVIQLPAGMHHPNDVGDAADPRGLPRLNDYVISSIESHTLLGDNLFDLFSGKKETTLMKVVEREYKLDRYAKRAAATPDSILRHYRQHIELVSGKVESQSPDKLKGSYILGDLPVTVTVEIRDGGKRYLVSTGGLGGQEGTTTTVSDGTENRQPPLPPKHISPPPATATPTAVDPRPIATSSFRMPSEATLWPNRGTRGMAVLLVGPGVHRATAVRFDASEGDILARENARLRVRVPMLPTGNYNVTVVGENGSDLLRNMFFVIDSPRADAAILTVPPCDGRPEKYGVSIMDIEPRTARPGQTIKLFGRQIDNVTHLTFTVAQDDVDPRITGIDPDLIGIDFGASGKARSAPRWLDTLSTNIGSSYGAKPSHPGECDAGNLSGYAAVKHTADGEMIVCVPPLAMSGPIGVWRADGQTGDVCDTTDIPLQIEPVVRTKGQSR